MEKASKERIVVVGVGDAGSDAVSSLSKKNIKGVDLVAVPNSLKMLGLFNDKSKGVPTGAAWIKESGSDRFYNLRNMSEGISGAKKVFILSWIGWGTSDTPEAAKMVARLAKKEGANVDAIAMLPLEHNKEYQRSIRSSYKVRELAENCDHVQIIDSNKVPNSDKMRSEEKAFRMIYPDILRYVTAKLRY